MKALPRKKSPAACSGPIERTWGLMPYVSLPMKRSKIFLRGLLMSCIIIFIPAFSSMIHAGGNYGRTGYSTEYYGPAVLRILSGYESSGLTQYGRHDKGFFRRQKGYFKHRKGFFRHRKKYFTHHKEYFRHYNGYGRQYYGRQFYGRHGPYLHLGFRPFTYRYGYKHTEYPRGYYYRNRGYR